MLRLIALCWALPALVAPLSANALGLEIVNVSSTGSSTTLLEGGDVITLDIKTMDKGVKNDLLDIRNVKNIDFLKKSIRVTALHGDRVIPEAMDVLRKHKLETESVSLHKPTLEDVYIKYTGKQLRDEVEGKKGQFKRSMRSRRRFRH